MSDDSTPEPESRLERMKARLSAHNVTKLSPEGLALLHSFTEKLEEIDSDWRQRFTAFKNNVKTKMQRTSR